MTRSRIGTLTMVGALVISGSVLSQGQRRVLGAPASLFELRRDQPITSAQSPATNPQSPATSSQSQLIDVLHYDAAIEPDLDAHSVKGRVTIDFVMRASGVRSVEFDSAALVVDAVTEADTPLVFEQERRKTRISLRMPSAARERHRISVSYHGTPGRAVQFSSEPPFVATIFTTSEWLVCVDAPGDKATLRLTLTTAREPVAASGKEVSRALRGGRLVTEWREDRPMPTYTFGFAVGRFTERMQSENGVQLVMLGAGFSPDELARLAADTADGIRFFADRSGVSYAGSRYTQVVAGTGVGQEMSRFSLLPASYGQAILAEGGTTSLGIHELAHQWWGNLVTCANWTDLWLNEGFATFMTAAYAEHRLGRAAYLTQIEVSRSRYERVREAGHDRPLQFHDWNRPTADDRTLVYHKGAYVLSRLRDKLGDELFWRGVRAYTQAHAQKNVSSLDLERSMEQASGLDLSEFFAEWVFGR